MYIPDVKSFHETLSSLIIVIIAIALCIHLLFCLVAKVLIWVTYIIFGWNWSNYFWIIYFSYILVLSVIEKVNKKGYLWQLD